MPAKGISPREMAEIYWNRMRYAAFSEVERIVDYYKASNSTTRYWKSVLDNLTLIRPPIH